MKQHRCLYCYQELSIEGADLHEKCSQAFFGTPQPPIFEYGRDDMARLAKEIVVKSIAVTGVQAKLSLDIEKNPNDPATTRFTIVGLWGGYILKPPTDQFPFLPENEDLTMHLAAIFGIETAQHTLIRLTTGELAYLTRRFDRFEKGKLALEDMCQLTETLTEDKYRSSMERVGKHIARYATAPVLDMVHFLELSIFCFLTGNADMHLKNFSLLTTVDREIKLSPAYDLVSTRIALPEDLEEMALTINARKNKLKKNDFLMMAKTIGINEKAARNAFTRLEKSLPAAIEFISISFLPKEMKEQYRAMITEFATRLEMM
ncbi:MAG: type II toxin-antitoxin system HipA family toxin [Chitinophagaceae bacterium]|nr:MAG: type II toxin-antitoxin system HipA family toxin [Chitinophagaceae bacterium]